VLRCWWWGYWVGTCLFWLFTIDLNIFYFQSWLSNNVKVEQTFYVKCQYSLFCILFILWLIILFVSPHFQQKTMRTASTGRKVDERNQGHYECNGLFWFPRTSVISYYYNYNYNTTLFWELPLLYNCLCMLLVMHPWFENCCTVDF
jgi:hypothetical protein